uniref:Ribonuclease H-like domain-containing protein n=1 Tax=Tanacetum cinerariifolium TaxID=118510 RepID=A0A699IQY7_TANCI|nr:ribonuclease H-like domain-containing protein [Tanacetum cinerariifolium]
MPEVHLEKDDIESWTLFTDGASSPKGSGAGLVLIGPNGIKYTYALHLTFPSTNNEVKYEALLVRLRIARQMNISNIEVKLDSSLWRIRSTKITKPIKTASQEVHTIVKEEGDNLMTPIIRCLERGIWLNDKNEVRCLRAKISQYAMESGILFKKGYLVPMLRCVGPLQANYVIREINIGSYGMHVGPRAVVRKEVRQGAEIAENPHDVHYGPVAILSMGHGHFRTTTPARGGVKFGLPWIIVTENDVQLVNDPFKSWCGREVVIPAEISIPTFPTLMIREGYNEEEMRLNPDLLQERKETTAIREARYKTKMEQYYNKKVRPTGFQPGEFVFRRNEAIGLRTKASWDQNGKDPTRSWNYTKMAPTS